MNYEPLHPQIFGTPAPSGGLVGESRAGVLSEARGLVEPAGRAWHGKDRINRATANFGVDPGADSPRNLHVNLSLLLHAALENGIRIAHYWLAMIRKLIPGLEPHLVEDQRPLFTACFHYQLRSISLNLVLLSLCPILTAEVTAADRSTQASDQVRYAQQSSAVAAALGATKDLPQRDFLEFGVGLQEVIFEAVLPINVALDSARDTAQALGQNTIPRARLAESSLKIMQLNGLWSVVSAYGQDLGVDMKSDIEILVEYGNKVRLADSEFHGGARLANFLFPKAGFLDTAVSSQKLTSSRIQHESTHLNRLQPTYQGRNLSGSSQSLGEISSKQGDYASWMRLLTSKESELLREVARVMKDKSAVAALDAPKGALTRLRADTIPFWKRHGVADLAKQDRAAVERALGSAMANFIQSRRELSRYLLVGDRELSHEMLIRNEIDLLVSAYGRILLGVRLADRDWFSDGQSVLELREKHALATVKALQSLSGSSK